MNFLPKPVFFVNFLIICVSVFIMLSICEITVRFLRPDLKDIVYSKYQIDRFRIHKPVPRSWHFHNHPDTGKEHLVIYNSLGLRQHRDFLSAKKPGVVRIGFLGDSFIENLGMEVQYSFTEPLDYLLNKTGQKFEVLNFGVGGYGTDQEYLQYMDETKKYDLDIVVYVYSDNDLANLITNKLFYIDKKGSLQYRQHTSSLFITIVKKFYITYLVIEAYKPFQKVLSWDADMVYRNYDYADFELRKKRYRFMRFLPFETFKNDAQTLEAYRIFRMLLEKWKSEANRRGQYFFVGLLPTHSLSCVQTELENMGIDYVELLPLSLVNSQAETSVKNGNIDNQSGNAAVEAFIEKIVGYLQGIHASPEHIVSVVKKVQNTFDLISSESDKKAIIQNTYKYEYKYKKHFWSALVRFVESANEKEISSILINTIALPQQYNQYYFKKDSHWNEDGNKMAAISLMKFLAQRLHLTWVDDQFIRRGLNEYYSAFGSRGFSESWIEEAPVSQPLKESIQRKYLYIEKYFSQH